MTHIKTELSPEGSPSEGHRDNPAQQCRDRGGRWDAEKQVCIMPGDTTKEKPVGFVTSPTGAQIVVPARELSTEELARQAEERELEDIRVQQEPIEAERARLFAEEAPVRRELDPILLGGEEGVETFPVIGPLSVLLGRNLENLFGKDIPPSPIQPEILRTLAFTEIEKREIERGLTRSEKFGEFAEALAIGDLVKFVPGLGAAERPSDNVQTILREIRVWKTIATDAESQVIRGTWTQTFAIDQVTEAENNIQRIQSRIRLLIQSSPELKFNSDGVNFIETKIFEAETRIFNAKLAINAGVSADPNDIQILIELQRSIDVEEFDIPGL